MLDQFSDATMDLIAACAIMQTALEKIVAEAPGTPAAEDARRALERVQPMLKRPA